MADARTDKPSNSEEEYFAREEIEKKRKLAIQQAAETAAKQREELKQLHYMKCPKCGMDLHTLKHGNIEIETCFNCHGVFLDAGELDQIIKLHGHEGSGKWMGAVLNLFKGK
ncbi:zf-TFIIB domain-containing protein [Pyxidicoccus parkwayensis]|uniref:Zf-TFIIB domain-containing protein n=1 Tax=Pyxidicoccus parkwayensis TaxID=2813578 RepID=A0ABX7NQJ7_9BACT|nr:zf-TFIIB domain-containing protein [Pyxidicoccus parkwaysis]QSQ19729.1 zf-TFIIB domain-containing protein [Pyxidicoccus parkwaysis]